MKTFNSDYLLQAWSLLNEYYDMCCTAYHRTKLDNQLHDANIPLTHVPWKSMVRANLCKNLFSDAQLKEMNTNTSDCYKEADIISSKTTVKSLLENSGQVDKQNLTETWFEVDELKERFQTAINIMPATRRARREMWNQILGYPTGYDLGGMEDVSNRQDEESIDLSNVLSVDEQAQMCTGDLIEFSGNRLHDAFYIYRLPAKGIWAQIQQMWSKHEIKDFIFSDSDDNAINEEIILVPAMDEYGYGVPYLFATQPEETLPEGAFHKYVDINCPLVSMHIENPTIILVQQHLRERLEKPVYNDSMNGEMSIELDRFPQEYVAVVDIERRDKKNVSWTRCAHYDGKQGATNLNDNEEIFFSRRVLESEEQYKKTIMQSHNK